MVDPSAALIRWQLSYTNLTKAEWASIEQLFEAAEGKLNSFTFVDPTDNLLMWSEDWTKPVWTVDPLLQITNGTQDPSGGSGAIRIANTAQGVQRVVQTIASASWFQYCFSIYLRSETPVSASLICEGGEESNKSVSIGANWTRMVHAGQLTSRQDGIAFGLELPPGAQIQAFAPQTEAQRAPGSYKKVTDRGGVYTNTRFDSDSLTGIADGPNRNSGRVTLVSGLTS